MSEVPATGREWADHWNATYENRGSTGVSWYQPMVTTSIDLIERLAIPTTAAIIDVGGGASVLADTLLERGFTDVSVLDVSMAALAEVRERLGARATLSLLQKDLLAWSPERRYGLWHDRAVFHFLVDPNDRRIYLKTLYSALRPGGFAIVGTFASDGPEYCSGLPVSRYSSTDLAKMLGPRFQVVESLRDRHVTPAGVEQPFTWVSAKYSPGQLGRTEDG